MKLHLPFGINASKKYLLCITKEEYKELMTYANERNVRLEGFKRYMGEIALIKEFVDDIAIIAEDFPKILNGQRGGVLD